MLMPLMTMVALAGYLTSGFPLFFSQVRVGRNGREFMLHKFRTMRVEPGAEKGLFNPGNCTRITPFGHFLRATKLDELPQLWNVLKGEISLVGPRPEVPKWVNAYSERWNRVLSIMPGITDPASIAFCNEELLLANSTDPDATYWEILLPRKLAIYESYLTNRSFLTDLGIILRTLASIVQNVLKREDLKHANK
jgi:lipopolysaccharide/colanic/teichoic acid biosynthesis glycosyltransferase